MDEVITGDVLLTGGTGSLGQAILSRAKVERWPCRFTIYSRDEAKQRKVEAIYPEHRYVLGDVRQVDNLRIAMRGKDLVIHAAAYKQVPAAEVNSWEAIETNTWGSRNIALTAFDLDIPRVVGISTDKACAPINCYGMTKALMEKGFAQASAWGRTKFVCVRYGNVLGSTGSVVPFFKRQQAEQGYITVTNPDMTRFWLSLEEAVDLVVMGTAEKTGGTVIAPVARASTMAVLAEAVCPGVEQRDIGIRAGEKMHESLVHSNESLHTDLVGIGKRRRFRILPAYTLYRGGLPVGFEYTSDGAEQYTAAELRAKLVANGDLE